MSASPLHRPPVYPHFWIAWFGGAQLLLLALWWQWGVWAAVPVWLLSHGLLLWGTFRPQSQLLAPALSRLPTTRREVWLTIDDGPSDDTAAILDLLDAHDARATFFLIGARAAARPQLVREIVRRGHGIGNHSQQHPQAWFWRLGPRRMRDEVNAAQQTLTALTGTAPRWFRAVVGMSNPFVAQALVPHRLARVAWSARGFDGVRADPAQVVARIERQLAPGAIVLMHEGAPHGRNVETLALLLARLRALGYRTLMPEPLEADGRPASTSAHDAT